MERAHESVTKIQTAELPSLTLTTTRSVSDFEVERTTIEASGYTTGEAIAGFDYILSKLMEVRR